MTSGALVNGIIIWIFNPTRSLGIILDSFYLSSNLGLLTGTQLTISVTSGSTIYVLLSLFHGQIEDDFLLFEDSDSSFLPTNLPFNLPSPNV